MDKKRLSVVEVLKEDRKAERECIRWNKENDKEAILILRMAIKYLQQDTRAEPVDTINHNAIIRAKQAVCSASRT